MFDNTAVCKDWRDTIRRVQNTHLHELQKDGAYLDQDGNPLTDSTGVRSGLKGVIKGVRGSIARARGKGRFQAVNRPQWGMCGSPNLSLMRAYPVWSSRTARRPASI